MNWQLAAQVLLIVFGLWLFTAWMSQSFPVPHGKRIALVIAHPDDEAMFFAPALLALTRPELGNHVVIICFSAGDADGLGHIRKDELKKSALLLGLKSAEHVVVIDDPKHFPDSMTTEWNTKTLATVMTNYFAPNMAKVKPSEAPQVLVDIVLTFDAHGVSNHPNHRSLYEGARFFLKDMMRRHAGWDCPIKLYTLTTTNVLRKYMSLIDSVATILNCIGRTKEKGQFPTPMLFVSGPLNMRTAQKAMTTAHKSQMRWFRWGWIGISRYMIINDLRRVKVA